MKRKNVKGVRQSVRGQRERRCIPWYVGIQLIFLGGIIEH